ncbi:MAG: DNA repair protein RecO [Candidatus Methanosuratincola sp.]|jgi:DNA repair protein RecO (recombination protein O)
MKKTEALVIRKTPYGEADLMVDLFTREGGKVRCLAKNARRSKRRFGGRLEPYQLLNVLLRERRNAMTLLVDSEVVRAFPSFAQNLSLFLWGSLILETIDMLMPIEDPDPRAFDLAVEAIAALESGEEAEGCIQAFQLGMLSIAGYKPDFATGEAQGVKTIKKLCRYTERHTGRHYKSLKFLEELKE